MAEEEGGARAGRQSADGETTVQRDGECMEPGTAPHASRLMPHASCLMPAHMSSISH